MSDNLDRLVAIGIKLQRVAYNTGHDNKGASIDVLAYILKEFDDIKRYARNRRVQYLISEIKTWDLANDALKYAKPLAQNTRLSVRREILQARKK